MFKHPSLGLKVGRALQFSKKETKGNQRYKGNYAKLTDKIEVICTLYSIDDQGSCSMLPVSTAEYFPLSSYICMDA